MRMMPALDNHEIQLLKNRDPEFLKNLFETINPSLFKLLGSQKVFGESAEELIQDTWQTFFEKLELFEGRSQIRTYVSGILINKLREHRRFYQRVMCEEDSEKIYAQSFTPEGWWKKEPADPQQILQSTELLKMIEECLDGLSEPQREAFVLKEVDQELTQDICNILNVTVTHLGVLIFRAKEKLRLCIEGKIEV